MRDPAPDAVLDLLVMRPDAPDLPPELEAVATLDRDGLEAARLTDATLAESRGAERRDRRVRA